MKNDDKKRYKDIAHFHKLLMMQKNTLNEARAIPSKLNYSKKDVQRAGEALIIENISTNDPDIYKKSMFILSNWRSRHVYSLDQITTLVHKIAIKEDRKAIIAKRLKRTPSIVNKLRRFNKMKLRNMQDIAGCRAILSTHKQVYKVSRKLNKSGNFKMTDYIKHPKEDGYRGIHLICKYADEKGAQYPVEIQLRSKVQHSWATAVEIIDLFTNQTLKSNDGKKDWLDFFKYISHEFSKLERLDNEPIENSMEESIRLIKKLNIYKKFSAYAQSLEVIGDHVNNNLKGYNLIQINFKEKTLKVWSYPYSDFDQATAYYLTLEKEAEKNNKYVVALISSKSISNLREAYPNYFADSELFIKNIKAVEIINNMKNPHWLLKWMFSAGFRNHN